MNNHIKNISFRIILLSGILSTLLPGGALYAQGRVGEVIIPEGGIDTTAFPSIAVRAIVSDDTRGRVETLTESDFTLRENGQDVPFTLSEVPDVGIQVVFVLDASRSVLSNGATGYSRMEEGKQVIYNFAQDHMAEGIDRVAVLAPASSTTIQKVVPLPDDPEDFTIFKSTVHDGAYLYELPEGITNTPLSDLVSSALNMLRGSQNGMYQAVVVISDGIDVISDREVADIVRAATDDRVPIYTVMFGPTWPQQAEANMKRLSLDTFGEHLQLSAEARNPEPLEGLINQVMAPLYEKLNSQRTQYLLTYDSVVSSSGRHDVGLAVGSRSGEGYYSIIVEPPKPSIEQPAAGAQIERKTDDPTVSATDIEPRTRAIVFKVDWPDGHPRAVEAVDLLVDGVLAVQDACLPPCTEITWNIASLGAGSHSIRVRVRGQQGLEGESAEVPVSISIITPAPTPTPTPTPIPTATPPLTCEEEYSGLTEVIECRSGEVLGLGAFCVSGVALLLVIILLRRPPQVVSTVVRKVKEATEPFLMDRGQVRAPHKVMATLIVLEGDESHTEPIELISENTRMGRDEELAQVVFQNRAVSRLHARIIAETDQQGGQRFVLYDEGSTSGTYVNYEPVGINGQQLQHDDAIHLGPVQLQFKIKKKVAHDDTQVMLPVFVAEPEGDEFATAPFVPAQPEPELDLDQTQPFAAQSPARAPAPPPEVEQDEEDGMNTEPFIPMDFGDE